VPSTMRVTGPAAESPKHIGGTLSGPTRAPSGGAGRNCRTGTRPGEAPPSEVTMATIPIAVALLVVIGLVRLVFFSRDPQTPNR
jgi:hypothetical protein